MNFNTKDVVERLQGVLVSFINFVMSLGKFALEFEKLKLGTRHKYISENGKYIYHIAIIDYLQAYNLEK